MLAHDGSFYGSTHTGGANGNGTAFRVSTDGTLTVLHDFTQFEYPFGAFVEAADGNLYNAGGGILRMTLSGDVSSLGISFVSALIGGRDGRIYASGHSSGFFCEREALFSFLPGGEDRRNGSSEIPGYLAVSLQARDGSIFGIGGSDCHQFTGSHIYRFTPSGAVTFPAKFPVFANSYVSLTEDSDGQLFGTTSAEGPSGSGTIFRLSPGSSTAAPGDADGDGESDLMLYNDATGVWTIDHAGAFGYYSPGDIPVPADYAGSGAATRAVFSSGIWKYLPYPYPYPSTPWGGPGDVPVPADYDGDGKADVAVYRPSNGHWYVLNSKSNLTTSVERAWGEPGDVPVPADYDGDGIADVAVYRPSTGVWYVLTSTSSFGAGFARTWGLPSDIPIVGDFDKDGKSDLAVYRPASGVWFVLTSGSNYATWIARQWGTPGDIPVAGDYDGDGIADMTIFRPSTANWFVLKSSTNFTTWDTYLWGNSSDRPVLGPH